MRLPLRLAGSSIATFVAVGGAVAFVFWQFHPSLLFLNSTTSGGDTGAHVMMPAFMRDHLLPHGRLTGWDPGWYDGFPAFTFYFPLPSLLIVLLNVVLPYNIAFKLVTALGSLALPVAAWAFGRMWGLKEPAPACLGVASLLFLFDRSYTIYGGNIPSTLAGEFSFSMSLAAALVFFGVCAQGMRTGRRAGLAAALLAVTGLCHFLPTLFALAGAVVILAMNRGWKQLRWMASVLVAGGLVAAFWWLPFLARLPYTTDMGWTKATNYVTSLFSHPASGGTSIRWVVLAAAAGLVLAVARRNRTAAFLGIMAVLAAVAFVVAPQGKIWNARLLPFWVLPLYLLIGLGIAEAGSLVFAAARRVAGRERPWPNEGVHIALVATAAVMLMVAVPLKVLPGWVPFKSAQASFIPDWVRWNYTGYQGKQAYPEYRAVIDTMQSVGRRYGCGRAMWEYESELNRFGTPMALMLLPYWTNGCVDSMEGLYFESSATTPYHFLDAAELSQHPSNPMSGLPYEGVDLAKGIAHLQMLGVRYYMTFSPEIQARADSNPDLQLVASSGPWPVSYSTGTKDRTWRIYLIRHAAQVSDLAFEPAVLQGLAKGEKAWLRTSVPWYQDPSRWLVPLAQSGPSYWPRVALGDSSPPQVPVEAAGASHVVTGDDRISFDVARTGSPVLVRVSYFPNWRATGAQGPWRVTPNLMVVIPTAHHVSLHYGWTPVDYLGWVGTLAGVLGVIWLTRHPPFEVEAEAEAGSGSQPEELAGEGPAGAGGDGTEPYPAGPEPGEEPLAVPALVPPEGDPEPGQPHDAAGGPDGDGAARGAQLLHDDGQLGNGQSRPLGPQDELAVEQVLAEGAADHDIVDGGEVQDLHAMGVGRPQAEPGSQDPVEGGGHDPSG